jgi:hypothetical protein
MWRPASAAVDASADRPAARESFVRSVRLQADRVRPSERRPRDLVRRREERGVEKRGLRRDLSVPASIQLIRTPALKHRTCGLIHRPCGNHDRRGSWPTARVLVLRVSRESDASSPEASRPARSSTFIERRGVQLQSDLNVGELHLHWKNGVCPPSIPRVFFADQDEKIVVLCRPPTANIAPSPSLSLRTTRNCRTAVLHL